MRIFYTPNQKVKHKLTTSQWQNKAAAMGSIANTIDSYDNVMSFADDTFSLRFDDSSAPNDDSASSLQDGKMYDCMSTKSEVTTDMETVRCEVKHLVANETKHVNRLRRTMIIVMLGATIGTFFLILSVNVSKEDNNFYNSYNSQATIVLNDFPYIFQQRLKAMISLKSIIESYAVDNQQSQWPFVTVPSIQHRLSTVLNLTGSLFFTYGPFVSDRDIFAWEKFSRFSSDTLSSMPVNNSIHYLNKNNEMIIDSGPGPYLVRLCVATGRFQELPLFLYLTYYLNFLVPHVANMANCSTSCTKIHSKLQFFEASISRKRSSTLQ
jgi:hypothetical protein